MMEQPLVSVICLCYNHSAFVREAAQSVMDQTYSNVELILVDDASSDNSVAIIEELQRQYPSLKTILLKNNVGNCKAFNQGLAASKGTYIIDLAADDILLPDRIKQGVEFFQKFSHDVGVIFSDAEWINEEGDHQYFHSTRFPHADIPQGDIYIYLIETYFICSPTMMFRRGVMDQLNGYDESLAYEDFDFWIRSSRIFRYAYSPEVTVRKRIVKNSMSKRQQRSIQQQRSTFRVCEKIYELNRNEEERAALSRRIRYEIRMNLRQGNLKLVADYFSLLKKNYHVQF
jgi:glycosyltransferase involved in cell wall biosynthesis